MSLAPDTLPGSPDATAAAGRLSRKLYLIYSEISALMLVAGAALFFLSLEMTPRQILIGLVISTLTYIPMIGVDLLLIRAHFKPIGRFLRAPPDQATTLAAPALLRSLNLPLLTFIRVLLVHFPIFATVSSALVAIANRTVGFGFQGWQYGALILLLVFLGCLHAVYEYFAVVTAVRPVIPMIREHTQRAGLPLPKRPTRVLVRHKLIVASTLAGIIPLAVLGGTTVFKTTYLFDVGGVTQPQAYLMVLWQWVAWLTLISAVVVLMMSAVLARDVSYPATELVTAMQKVGDGALDARLVVTTTDEFADLFEGFNQMTQGLQERERLRDAFGRYMGPVADQVLQNGVQLGGELVNASILFADIRSFTSLSEKMAPAQVVALLNGYFTAVERVIEAEGGWINKFGGDSLLAVFGAPMKCEDHAGRALRAACRMREALAAFNRSQHDLGMPELAIGIGVHCGDVLAGNVGSPTRLEYTVIGDVVNVAARLQALTKEYGTDLIVSGEALERAGQNLDVRPLGDTTVRGKSQPLQIFAVSALSRAA